MSAIWATRRSWRPPSKGVVSQSSRISLGQPGGRRCGRPWTARWRRCARGSCGRCRGRCTGRPARRAPCWRRSARPGRSRRARCRGRRRRARRPGRRPRRSAGSRPTRCCRCRGRATSWPRRAELGDQVGLEVVAGVVGADGDPHADALLPTVPRPTARRPTSRPSRSSSSVGGGARSREGAADRVGDVVGVVVAHTEQGVAATADAQRGRATSSKDSPGRRAPPLLGRGHELLQGERAGEALGSEHGHLADVLAGHAEDEVGPANERRRRPAGSRGRTGRGPARPSRSTAWSVAGPRSGTARPSETVASTPAWRRWCGAAPRPWATGTGWRCRARRTSMRRL